MYVPLLKMYIRLQVSFAPLLLQRYRYISLKKHLYIPIMSMFSYKNIFNDEKKTEFERKHQIKCIISIRIQWGSVKKSAPEFSDKNRIVFRAI